MRHPQAAAAAPTAAAAAAAAAALHAKTRRSDVREGEKAEANGGAGLDRIYLVARWTGPSGFSLGDAEVGAGTASCSRPRRPQLSKRTLGSEAMRPPTALK